MSQCTHPTSALFVDTQRGRTHCTLCGDVVMDDQLELDPVFSRGARPPAGRAGGGAGGALRGLGDSFRPSTGFRGDAALRARPNIDAARNRMITFARQLEISDDIVEIALGIYKVALGMNAISGTRDSVLCACLYIACRREHTSHVIYDFSEMTNENPHTILSQMRLVCQATHTVVPNVDPTCYVQRFAEQMDLGDRIEGVVVCALKVLRAMEQDWITCGRRPMGVCAAALLVACYVFGIHRSPEQVCGMVRLTSATILRRLNEFAVTPTAKLQNIDDYVPQSDMLPPAFGKSSLLSTEEDVNAPMREVASVYYELIAGAKTSQPPTPERCAKWRAFISRHCAAEGLTPTEDNLDLTRLTPRQQLDMLGLPLTEPIPAAQVEESIKREEFKLAIKQEEASESMRPVGSTKGPSSVILERRKEWLHAQSAVGDEKEGTSSSPKNMEWMTNEYTRLLNSNAEVRGLREDFDFSGNDGASLTGMATPSESGRSISAYTQNSFFGMESATRGRGSSPAPASPLGSRALGDADGNFAAADDLGLRLALEEVLYDKERRYALPWEFIVLADAKTEDCSDILQYLILDNEERERKRNVGKALFKDSWNRGRARTENEIKDLELSRAAKRRRRQVITAPATNVSTAMQRALRGHGAGTVSVSQIDELIPGLFGTGEDYGNEEWD